MNKINAAPSAAAEHKSNSNTGYALMDIMKFVFACLIVLFHIHKRFSSPGWLDYNIGSAHGLFRTLVMCPLMRFAVPFFFIVSGYFFFRKAERTENKKDAVLKYCKRNMILYGVWFLINIVYVIKVRGIRIFVPGHQNIHELLSFMDQLFFASTFGGSWFLMACILDALILGVILYVIKSEKLAWIVSILFFVLSCLSSNYEPLTALVGNGLLRRITENGFVELNKSFGYGLIYFMLGRQVVRSEEKINISMRGLIAMAIAAYLLMLAEISALHFGSGTKSFGNSLIMYPVMSVILLLICIKSRMEYKTQYMLLRKASTVIYCSHMTVLWCLNYVSPERIQLNTGTLLVLTVGICTIISAVIISLNKRHKIFSYLY